MMLLVPVMGSPEINGALQVCVMSDVASTHMMNLLMLCECVYRARSGQRVSVGLWHVASMTVL